MSKKLTKKLTGNFHRCHVKKGDQVIIIAGDHKGQKGIVKKVSTKFINGSKIKIEGINFINKKIKDNQSKPQYIKIEDYIHASNVRKI